MSQVFLTTKYVSKFVYFNSTLAPAASSFFLNSSASFLATPPLISLGAASTKSLASFKPKPVIALTSLITLIFLSPAAAKKRENSDFSSPAGAAAAPAGAAATGAAAVGPQPLPLAKGGLISVRIGSDRFVCLCVGGGASMYPCDLMTHGPLVNSSGL